MSLVKFFQGSQFAEEMGGSMSGDIYLLGVGDSLANMFSSARGDGRLFLRDGKVSALLVEAGGIDIAESLGVLLARDAPIAMPCAGLSLTASDGSLNINRAMAVTSDSLIQAVGQVALESLSFRVTLEARAWDFSLLDLSAPVTVEGNPAGVKFSIGKVDGFPLFKKGAGAPINCDTMRQLVSKG